MATSYVLVAACVLLSVIPGFLSKPADIETFGDERRWAEPRDMNPYYANQMQQQMQQQMQPMPNDIAYTKKNQAVHSGSFEANYKVSSKKADCIKDECFKVQPAVAWSYFVDDDYDPMWNRFNG